MAEINLLARYPRSKRSIARRAAAQSAANITVARQYGREYFDGSRDTGYGGYRYDGRWVPVAEDIVSHFGLKTGERVLDVGCAKGFLLKDLLKVEPGLRVYGVDISQYGLANAEPEIRHAVCRADCRHLPFADGSFDAVICINTVHNVERPQCVQAVREIERLAPGRGYIQVDSYRTSEERDLFLSWVLTARTHYDPEGWKALFAEAGYTGAYYWTIIE